MNCVEPTGFAVVQRQPSRRPSGWLRERRNGQFRSSTTGGSSEVDLTASRSIPMAQAERRVHLSLHGPPISPQEKRIIIASTRAASLADVAAALNITLESLKNYVHGLLWRYEVSSRAEMVDRVLQTSAPGDPLIA